MAWFDMVSDVSERIGDPRIRSRHPRSLPFRKSWTLLFCLGLSLSPLGAGEAAPGDAIPEYTYRIIHTFDHDPDAFTQGLVYHNGFFYEGTGLYGGSSLRRIEPQTGEVLQIRELADNLFGEGVTILADKIYQLTWRSHIGFVYDLESFKQLDTFHYPTEGWGLTHDGDQLIMSDGSAELTFLDPGTFNATGRIDVTGPDGPVTRLNELEYIEGEIWANVWLTDTIVRIDPESGELTGNVDLSGLLDSIADPGETDVLNGIAYDDDNDRLFVTGKLWPALFEIELFPKPTPGRHRILDWQVQDETLEISFYAPSGFSYSLETSGTLHADQWTQTGPSIRGADRVLGLSYPISRDQRTAFLRLKVADPQ